MIYELSKENVDLAVEEVLSLLGSRECEVIGNYLVCGAVPFERLAFTNKVFEEIFISDKVEDVDWAKYYEDNFCVRCNVTSKEKELAKVIWQKLEKPKVKLVDSKSEFHFIFLKDKVLCGKKVFTRKEKFHLRRPDLRPGFFPVSVKPKLARVLVNLSGVKEGVVWDPFCGTGGILLEAALMKLKVVGTDVDEAMVRAAKKNFVKYNIEGELRVGDARKEKVECSAIVTDPPYGRRASLKKVEIEELYKDFLEHVYPFVDKVVIMAPNDLKIVSKYKVTFETAEYVHASLTRKIIVLDK